MVAYQNALSELSLAKMVPVQYSVSGAARRGAEP